MITKKNYNDNININDNNNDNENYNIILEMQSLLKAIKDKYRIYLMIMVD